MMRSAKDLRVWARPALFLVMSALLAGCGSARPGPDASPAAISGPAQPVRGGVLQHGVAGSEAQSMDPLTLGGEQLTYNRLLEHRAAFYEDTTLVPSLLEEWSVSPDGKKYTLRVRKGVKWQNLAPVNGREFTAEDVAWNLGIWSQNSVYKSNFRLLERVDLIDRYTVELHLAQAAASFIEGTIGNYRLPMLAREVYEADGHFRDKTIGTGWMIFDKWEKGTSMSFRANPDYWETGSDGGALPYVDGWVTHFLKEEPAMIAAFRAGKLDFLGSAGGILKESFEALKADFPNLRWQDGERANIRFLEFNYAVKPLDDLRVRQAICLAVNQGDIINLAVDGDAKWSGLIPVAITDYAWPEEKIRQVYVQDTSKARQLLREAGHSSLTLELSDYGGGPEYRRGGEYLQQALAAIGVQTTLKRLPSTGAASQYEQSGAFQLMLAAGRTTFEVDDWITGPFHSKSGRNWGKFSDPEFDRLAEAQLLELDKAKRKQIVDKIQEFYVQKMVACPLWHKQTEHRVWSNRLENMKTFHWSVGWPHFQELWIRQ